MKKVVLILIALLLVACSSAPAGYKEGTYEGTGQGFHEDGIKVSVTVDAEGKISKVEVLEHQESVDHIPEVTPALTEVPARIVEKNSTEVDVTSGASRTSEGIMEAVSNALENAK